MNPAISALHDLPITPDEYWVARMVRLPGWVDNGSRPPYRPWAGIRTGQHAGVDISDVVTPAATSPELVVTAIVRTAQRVQRLPAALHMWDEATASFLAQTLKAAGLDIEVLLAETRHPAIDAIIKDMAQFGQKKPPLDGLLSGKDVTLDLVRRFADAALLFCEAQPWRVFDSDSDLLHIVAPDVPPLMPYVAVMGRSGQEYGLTFYAQPDDFFDMLHNRVSEKELRRQTRFFASRSFLHELPMDDADLWEDHQLPLSEGQTLLPAIVYPRKVERPDAQMLLLMEGILRALAASTDADLDAGTWSREVPAGDAMITRRFSLVMENAPPPTLPSREAMEATIAQLGQMLVEGKLNESGTFSRSDLKKARQASQRSKPSPREQAQEMIYQAWDIQGRESVKLAKAALELWPDAADAYNILAREFNNPQDALNLYTKALDAAHRDLAPDFIQESTGHFWGLLETRPYMRALGGRAHALWINGNHTDAIAHAQTALRLNPNDNQGIRDSLIAWLLHEHRDADAAALLKKHDDATAWWAYANVLLAFRLAGPDANAANNNAAQALKELQHARKQNRHVPPYLTGKKSLPPILPETYSPGEVSEAILCAKNLAPAWKNTPGAIEWLTQQTAKKRPTKS